MPDPDSLNIRTARGDSLAPVRELARAWIAVGTQSVGGGTSTLFLIRRLVVERHRWVTARPFTEDWALSQLSPGIHLVALAGLLGDRIAGWRGVVISVAGMMVPAAIVTAALREVPGVSETASVAGPCEIVARAGTRDTGASARLATSGARAPGGGMRAMSRPVVHR